MVKILPQRPTHISAIATALLITKRQRQRERERERTNYLSEDLSLSMPDGQVLILCGIGHDLQQSLDLGLVVEGHAEQL